MIQRLIDAVLTTQQRAYQSLVCFCLHRCDTLGKCLTKMLNVNLISRCFTTLYERDIRIQIVVMYMYHGAGNLTYYANILNNILPTRNT